MKLYYSSCDLAPYREMVPIRAMCWDIPVVSAIKTSWAANLDAIPNHTNNQSIPKANTRAAVNPWHTAHYPGLNERPNQTQNETLYQPGKVTG